MTLQQISGPIILDIPTDPAVLFLVRGMVERLACRLDFPRPEIDQLVLAVDEACTNAIRHAYNNRPNERIRLTFNADPQKLEIFVRDFGIQADPQRLKPRELSDVRPGGLGIYFIQTAMDRVEYEIPPDGGTLLKMIKLRTPQGNQQNR